MCIIAVSEVGRNLPSMKTIEQMWSVNDDGAGFMYTANGKVIISKGYMTLDSFKTAIEKLTQTIDTINTPVVMHFRIGTHGGNVPANTHPFPVTDKVPLLQKLGITCDSAIAHNGIIRCITPREKISDTMEFVASVLTPLKHCNRYYYNNPELQNLIETLLAGDRMVHLTGDGQLTYFGNWVEDEDGIKYSNHSYEAYDRYWNWRPNPDDFNFLDRDDNRNNELEFPPKQLALIPVEMIIKSENDIIYEQDIYDFLMDNEDHVYLYDYNMDLAVWLKGWKVYTPNMNPYHTFMTDQNYYDTYETIDAKTYTTYFGNLEIDI